MNNTLLTSLLRSAERLGYVLIIAAACYAWWFFRIRVPEVREIPELTSSVPEGEDQLSAPSVVAYEDFQKIVQDRDLFSRKIIPVQAVVPLLEAARLPAHLKVVGLMIDGDPQVVIEDQISRQTLFITQAQETSGMKIDHIEGDKVFLSYQGGIYSINVKD